METKKEEETRISEYILKPENNDDLANDPELIKKTSLSQKETSSLQSSKSDDNMLNIKKDHDSLQLGLYTIVEEDKSQLNRSRLSDLTKMESVKKSKMNLLYFQTGEESKVFGSNMPSINESIDYKANSLLNNINIQHDFLKGKRLIAAGKSRSNDFVESSIYEPYSSDEESISIQK